MTSLLAIDYTYHHLRLQKNKLSALNALAGAVWADNNKKDQIRESAYEKTSVVFLK